MRRKRRVRAHDEALAMQDITSFLTNFATNEAPRRLWCVGMDGGAAHCLGTLLSIPKTWSAALSGDMISPTLGS